METWKVWNFLSSATSITNDLPQMINSFEKSHYEGAFTLYSFLYVHISETMFISCLLCTLMRNAWKVWDLLMINSGVSLLASQCHAFPFLVHEPEGSKLAFILTSLLGYRTSLPPSLSSLPSSHSLLPTVPPFLFIFLIFIH